MLHFPTKSAIAISATLAQKLFGITDAIGKPLRIYDKYDQKITAVFNDIQENSSLKFDFILPFEILKERWQISWQNSEYQLYITLSKNTDAKAASQAINAQVDKVMSAMRAEDKEAGSDDDRNFYLQPFREHYLHSLFRKWCASGRTN